MLRARFGTRSMASRLAGRRGWQRRLMRTPGRLRSACLALMLGTLFACAARAQETWQFDRTDSLGGHPTKVLGHPRVVDGELGKAIAFNGVDDALFVDVQRLA